jgi:hypothetical protein
MKKLILILVIISLKLNGFGQETNTASYRVINIGNIVDIKNVEEYSIALKNLLASSKTPVLLILNGDLTQKNRTTSLGLDSLRMFKMLQTISAVDHAKIIVIPGDRDWNHSKKGGLKKVKQLENLVEYDGFKNVKWVLDKGCPGPELIELDSNLLLMVINTQWWNHPYEKPTPIDGDCDIITQKDYVIEFENALAETEEKNLIIAGHFPLVEQSSPSFKNYILPFPIAGSFLASYHQNIGGTKDVVNERFNSIRKTMLKRISVKSGVIYLSGHDRNTQIIKENENYFINNGLPSQTNNTTKIKNALYSLTSPSITEVVYFSNGDITTNNYKYENASFHNIKELVLYKSLVNSDNSQLNIPTNYANKSCLKDVTSATFPENENTARTTGGNYQVSTIKKIIVGKHYRKSWNMPIDVPILNMDTTKSGLKAYDRGGGHQTTSVKMYGEDGYAYTFRSVNKDATRDLGADLKNSLIARQMQDNVSMQHPYGGLIVSKLLDNTNILHAQPTLYVLPENSKLGVFNKYSGLLGTLEDHQKNPKKVKHAFANADELLQSHELNRNLFKDYNNKIDAEAYLKARVFDILVGDHGKHQDNWKWAGYKNDTGTTYLSIPRDRDLVFVKWDGIIPWVADRKWALEAGENFGYKINDVKSLMWVARHPDRFLTNEMDKQDWLAASKYIQKQLTDSIIEEAAKTVPKETYELSGKPVADKLKTRIRDLDKYALQYYKLLAKQVDVVGSNKEEYFDVIRNNDGTVDVFIYNIKENSDSLKGDKLLYHRKFIPSETKEIRLYGLGGKDVFLIAGNTKKSINIIVVGGNGADVISDNSIVKTIGKQTKIYENSPNSNINLGSESKSITTWNKDLFDFQPAVFEYNRYLPLLSLNYSSNNGFGAGAGVTFTKREKYGNTDYSAKHHFSFDATTQQNNIFRYQSRFRNSIHKWDFQIGGLIANHHHLTNFFGIGNNTVKNDSLNALNYYKTTYNSYSANAGLIRDFWKKSSFTINAEIQHNVAQIGENTIIGVNRETESPIVFGTQDNTIFVATSELEIDFRDRSNLPEKGIRFYANYQNGTVTNYSSNYNIVKGFIEHFFTAYIPSPITLGIKVGGSTSNGSIPFYNLPFLGSQNNLRGYKNNRFTGKSTAFLNSELRIQLARFTNSFVPMKMGIKGFYDVGRVYSDYDINNQWHNGYGAGFYWLFLDEQFTINLSIARSEEEKNFMMFSLGKAFN